ncbi:MAG TPA: hypothetical protein VMB66_09655 [Candidatus Acidoferrales bacterium]|nr:hypothetical protein [Candidatus Acidoferrales bacterium]
MKRDQRLGHHSAQDAGGWADSAIFQEMDQFTKSAIVASICDGTLKWPLNPAADWALSKALRVAFGVR